MSFTSFAYLLFLPLVVIVHWLLQGRARDWFLLLASCTFYGWITPWFLILMLATLTIDWGAARGIDAFPARKKLFLAVSLLTTFTVLFVFKYGNFFVDSFVTAGAKLGFDLSAPHWKFILPVGISFYTFQSASYVIDVYRGEMKARRNWLDYALFATFFPQLVAGPIERAHHLLVQMEKPRHWHWGILQPALSLILWGLFKKLVIADNVAVLVNKVYAVEQPSWPLLWAATLAFGVQIYADFSAYSDLARGSAALMGVELRRNFRHPWVAVSPVDYWRRWHTSLSEWFRDYVYIPLGGNRRGRRRTCLNLFLTFLLSGLWHGASWNFVLWGAWHGVLVVIWHLLGLRASERRRRNESGAVAAIEAGELRQHGELSRPVRRGNPLAATLGGILTFLLVLFGWMLFRETDSTYLWRHLRLNPFAASADDWGIAINFAVYSQLLALPLWIHAFRGDSAREVLDDLDARAAEPWWRWGAVLGWHLLLLLAILVMRAPTGVTFLYFQF